MIGGYDVNVNETQLCKVLDWAVSKFPVKDEWDNVAGVDVLSIYLPGHNEHQGIVQIYCNLTDWTVVVDDEFKDELEYELH